MADYLHFLFENDLVFSFSLSLSVSLYINADVAFAYAAYFYIVVYFTLLHTALSIDPPAGEQRAEEA